MNSQQQYTVQVLVVGEPRAGLGRPARLATFWRGSARSKLDVEARIEARSARRALDYKTKS